MKRKEGFLTEARITVLAKYSDRLSFNSTSCSAHMIVNQIDREGNFAYEKSE